MKCLICGMDINISNFNINNGGLLEKNQREDFKYCPFCGVSGEYLRPEGEILSESDMFSGNQKYKVQSESLDENTSVILDHAMKLEIFNSEFYNSAVKLSYNLEIKETFEALSKIEHMHAIVHQKLGGFKALPTLVHIDYSKYNNDKSLLKLAETREIHAAAFYEKNGKKISNPIIKEVFFALFQVERDHIQIAGSY